ncbi:MAG: V-type ATP synthase subunit E [Myxococcales bacterium]|jgi:vacuolar-type H+-ATPase subunit E/Vma4|nr:V-type ATP synthase subunit E [Myxococcales bacterium]
MAKPGLDTELRRSAERTSESILGAARSDAKRLGTESERVVEDRRREVLKDKEAEYGAEARVAIAAERHAAMRAVLLARTHLVDRVLERAQALLPDVARNEAYLATLSSELTDALQFVEAEGTVVRCSEDLGPAVRDRMRDRPAVKVEPEADVGTGFVVVGAEGTVVVDGRLETRIDRLASVLAIEIHTRLQEEP